MSNNTPIILQQGSEVCHVQQEVMMTHRMPELQRGLQLQSFDVERTLQFDEI